MVFAVNSVLWIGGRGGSPFFMDGRDGRLRLFYGWVRRGARLFYGWAGRGASPFFIAIHKVVMFV